MPDDATSQGLIAVTPSLRQWFTGITVCTLLVLTYLNTIPTQ